MKLNLLAVAAVLGAGLLAALVARTGPSAPDVVSRQPAIARRSAAPAPAPAPTASARATDPSPGPAPLAGPPAWEAPPRTPTSWILPLELGWDDAVVGEPIHSPVAFRLARCGERDERFEARVSDASGRRYGFAFPVAGLLPRAMAKEQAELVLGDEVSLARAAVLLALPEIAFPAHVELITPDGQEVATLRLTEVAGAVRALRVR